MYQVADHVRAVADGDGTTLLDLKANEILALNKTGGLIWDGLQNGTSVDAIVTNIAELTGADKTSIEQDTQEFIAALTGKGLVSDLESMK